MGTTITSLSDEACRVLKAQKREVESFSDLILRKFGKGNPAAILAHLKMKKNLTWSWPKLPRKQAKDLCRSLKLERSG